MSISNKIHLRENENILETVRPHLLTYFIKYLIGLCFILVSAFFMFWLFSQGWLGYFFFGLGLFIGFFIIFKTWFFVSNNVLVITNERIVDVGRASWFEEVISSVSLLDIKDIFALKKGVFPNLFNYGKLVISTKNENVLLEISAVNRPQRWQSVILEIIDDYCEKRKVGSKNSVYKNFKKIICNLSKEELKEIRELIDEEIDENIDKEIQLENKEEDQLEDDDIEILDLDED